jgi:hypothetical protein
VSIVMMLRLSLGASNRGGRKGGTPAASEVTPNADPFYLVGFVRLCLGSHLAITTGSLPGAKRGTLLLPLQTR